MSLLSNAIATIKSAVDFGDTSKEMRLTISMVVSLAFFFGFLALSGDFWSAAGLTAALEIILLFTMHIM
jgi:hypothetical protein